MDETLKLSAVAVMIIYLAFLLYINRDYLPYYKHWKSNKKSNKRGKH
ncbi:MAG: hypothetical protein K2O85_01480 [Helicobacter sp.]|nr:hypothetical protein [Helicobacter sp.]MDE7316949.1 hypothetical protein [Helicobacter sp.]